MYIEHDKIYILQCSGQIRCCGTSRRVTESHDSRIKSDLFDAQPQQTSLQPLNGARFPGLLRTGALPPTQRASLKQSFAMLKPLLSHFALKTGKKQSLAETSKNQENVKNKKMGTRLATNRCAMLTNVTDYATVYQRYRRERRSAAVRTLRIAGSHTKCSSHIATEALNYSMKTNSNPSF